MKRAIQKLKVMIAAALCAAGIGTAQAFVSPGITINGTKPTKDGTYSGYTYQDGVFRLTSAGSTYTFAGQSSSSKVRIVAAANNCTIKLADGFVLDLRKRRDDPPPAESSPISISGRSMFSSGLKGITGEL